MRRLNVGVGVFNVLTALYCLKIGDNGLFVVNAVAAAINFGVGVK